MMGNAQALPDSQAKCNLGANNQQTIHPGESLKPLSNLVVRVNASSKTLAIVHVAADICVSAGAEARIVYSVDGSNPRVFGATNLANHQEFCETRATMAVIPLSTGKHKI